MIGRFNANRRNFYPRPLRGGRRKRDDCGLRSLPISIHALCEEGDRWYRRAKHDKQISIHALCEEGDVVGISVSSNQGISIHALCEEGDHCPF